MPNNLDSLARRVARLEQLIPVDATRQQWRRDLAILFSAAEYDAVRAALIDALCADGPSPQYLARLADGSVELIAWPGRARGGPVIMFGSVPTAIFDAI
jgi:hypothetical protein